MLAATLIILAHVPRDACLCLCCKNSKPLQTGILWEIVSFGYTKTAKDTETTKAPDQPAFYAGWSGSFAVCFCNILYLSLTAKGQPVYPGGAMLTKKLRQHVL